MIRYFYILIFLGLPLVLFGQETEIEYLHPEDFQNQYQQEIYAIIVDARTFKEYKKGHISQSINVPAMENLIPFADSLDHETPLYIYCEAESRSITVAKWLIDNEFTSVYILKGGLTTWIALDMKTVRGRKNIP